MRFLCSLAAIALLASSPAWSQVRDIPQPRIGDSQVRPTTPTPPGRVPLQRPDQPFTGPIALPAPGPMVASIAPTRAGKVGQQGVTGYSGMTANVTIARLPAGARVRAAHAQSFIVPLSEALREETGYRCRGSAFGRTVGSETSPDSLGVVDGQGRVSLAFHFSHNVPSGLPYQPRERCVAVLGIEVLTPGSSTPTPYILKVPPFEPLLRREVRYEQTWALRRYFNFTMLSEAPGSTCQGESIGPVQSHPVGPTERNGDLVIQIRSGPLGTACRAVSPGIAVDDQIELVQIDWEIEETGDKCCAGGECGEQFVFLPGYLPLDEPERYQDRVVQTGISSQVQYPRLGENQKVMGHAHIRMKCDMAGMNDHGVRLVLRSATFEAPPDANLP